MKTKITRIPLDKLVPHADNPNWTSRANLAKLARNIERTGCYEPLVVRPHPDKPGYFQIINGHHRCEALRELGHETADAVVWRVDDEQTAILLATLNRLGGRDSLDKKVTLLRRLRRHMSIPELSKLLPQTRGQLERLTARKSLSPVTSQGQNPSPVPLVFYVNQAQQDAVEQALRLATDPAAPGDSPAAPAENATDRSTRAGRRAAALTCLANLFIDLTEQTAGPGTR
jgi:ParB family chromosome partitioning protein